MASDRNLPPDEDSQHAWRQQAVQDALGSFAVEELYPGPEEREQLRRFEAGEISLEDLKDNAGIK